MQSGRVKERKIKEEKRSQKRDQKLWWEVEGEERFPHLGESPLQQGDDKRGASGAQKQAQQLVCGRQDKVRPTQIVCARPASPSHKDWVLECAVCRTDPERALLLSVERQPERMKVRCSTTRNARGGSTDHRRREAPWLSDLQRVWLPLQLLSSHPGPCRHRR